MEKIRENLGNPNHFLSGVGEEERFSCVGNSLICRRPVNLVPLAPYRAENDLFLNHYDLFWEPAGWGLGVAEQLLPAIVDRAWSNAFPYPRYGPLGLVQWCCGIGFGRVWHQTRVKINATTPFGRARLTIACRSCSVIPSSHTPGCPNKS